MDRAGLAPVVAASARCALRGLLAALACWAVAGCTPIRAPAVFYACEAGVHMEVRFERDHAVLLPPGGGAVRLPQQPSGSGFRYAGAGHALQGKGRELLWSVGQAQPLACLQIEPPAGR